MAYTLLLVGFLLFALLLLFVVASAFYGFLRTRVPFVPTSKNDIEFIVNDLNVTSKDIFYDLGSGNGKVCFMINRLTGARCVGFELTWWTYLWAKLKASLQNSAIVFKRRDFFAEDWSEATVIYGYLYPMLMGRVEEKFKKDMKPGSRAIIRDFPFPNMRYKKKYYLPKEHEIYLYEL